MSKGRKEQGVGVDHKIKDFFLWGEPRRGLQEEVAFGSDLEDELHIWSHMFAGKVNFGLSCDEWEKIQACFRLLIYNKTS